MSKLKLLLADDSITIQKVVNLTFADEGIDVISVGDGNTAMDKIREESPDLIMADVNMPGLNGYEICEKIKQSDTVGNTPVILLVGSFEPFDEIEAKRVGADDYLTKPFQSINQLVNTVNVLINSEPFPKSDESVAELAASAGSNGSESDTYELPAQPPVFEDSGIDDEMIQADQVGSETESAFESFEPSQDSESFQADSLTEVSDSDADQQLEESTENAVSEIPGFAFVERTQTFEFVVEEPADEEEQELESGSEDEVVESAGEEEQELESGSEDEVVEPADEEEQELETRSEYEVVESADEEEPERESGSEYKADDGFDNVETAEFAELSPDSSDFEEADKSEDHGEIELDEVNLLEIPVVEREEMGDKDSETFDPDESAGTEFEALSSDLPESFGDQESPASFGESTKDFAIATEISNDTVDLDSADESSVEASRIDVASPEFIEEVSKRVVEHLSDGAIRDVAREIVPEIAEKIIRETAEEKMRE